MNDDSEIMDYIYFRLIGHNGLMARLAIYEKHYEDFCKAFFFLYGRTLDLAGIKINSPEKTEELLENADELRKLHDFVKGGAKEINYFLENINSSREYGLNFINMFNLEYKIFGFEKISLIAAGSKSIANGSYLIKNMEFHNYFYSICKEAEEVFRFEILSNSGSMDGNNIRIVIRQPDGKVERLEEMCGVLTDKFILYFNGQVNGETEIFPEIS